MRQLIKQRVLVLDGAMGTMIQRYGLTEEDFRGQRFADVPGQMRGNNDMLCLTRPDVVADIHRKYLEAGADIIETNTFSTQRISQADYHLEPYVREMALAGARLARREADRHSTADKPRFVAGSIGPTNKTLSMSPDVSNPAKRELTFDQLRDAYEEQVDALVEGGVDLLLIETIFDTLNAKAAIVAAMDVMRRRGVALPIMLSVTVSDLAGRTLSGQTLDAFLASVSSYPIFSLGLNCSFGADQMLPYLRHLAEVAPYYITAYPNAGLPNQLGLYDETPESMAPKMARLVDEGLVNIIGGCCGTTDEFIRLYAPIVEGKRPHVPAPSPSQLWLSGLEVKTTAPNRQTDAPFLVVGERCNVAGSRKFLRLISEKRYDEAVSIARHQVANGADIIDINMDDALLDAEHEMAHFLNLLAAEPDISRLPVMIDSSRWPVITRALGCIQGKAIVNSISLKEGEATFLSHARDAVRMGAAVVVMCFDEQGQATTYERRIEIAQRAYHLLTEQAGMRAQDIIFDPNILAIATGMKEHDSQALDFIRATRWIKTHLPGAHVSGGVSNLSFAFRGNNALREAMHTIFLHHARQNGMDFGIVNPASRLAYRDIPKDRRDVIEDALLCRRDDAAERLVDLAGRMMAEKEEKKEEAKGQQPSDTTNRKQQPVEERLKEALLNGTPEHLEEDLREAAERYPKAVDIVEGPLMEGMNRVGELFGEGKMFLPQVVKSARTMKQAVEMLLGDKTSTGGTAADASQHSAGRVLLATVKGDVHDIGKNIVSVVMACNGFEIIDMGVMVPAEQIVRKAREEHVDIIGLSGLITPSLEEMAHVAELLREAGLNIPIMIGGATTSQLHVALKIAPVYGGPVVWMKDASQNPIVATKLLDRHDGRQLEQELNKTYELMRNQYQQEQQQLLSLEEARRKKPHLF